MVGPDLVWFIEVPSYEDNAATRELGPAHPHALLGVGGGVPEHGLAACRASVWSHTRWTKLLVHLSW